MCTLRRSSHKVPIIIVRFECNFNFLDRTSENNRIKNSIKIRPVAAELFHADGQIDVDTGISTPGYFPPSFLQPYCAPVHNNLLPAK